MSQIRCLPILSSLCILPQLKLRLTRNHSKGRDSSRPLNRQRNSSLGHRLPTSQVRNHTPIIQPILHTRRTQVAPAAIRRLNRPIRDMPRTHSIPPIPVTVRLLISNHMGMAIRRGRMLLTGGNRSRSATAINWQCRLWV